MSDEAPLVIDTRERKPYRFAGIDNIVYRELNVGDYTRSGFEDAFSVERKSLDDLANSLTSSQGNRERFEDEIERAQSLSNFVVVIEAPKSAVYDYAGEGLGGCPNYYSNIAPNSVIGTTEKWPEKYETLRFEWCGTREGAKQRTLQLLDKWYLEQAL